MFFHIQFEDGSNPYVFYGNKNECKKNMKRWEKNYKLTELESGFYYAEAKEEQR